MRIRKIFSGKTRAIGTIAVVLVFLVTSPSQAVMYIAFHKPLQLPSLLNPLSNLNGVLLAPQRAEITDAVKVSYDQIQFNGHQFDMDANDWNLRLLKPKRFLYGAEEIYLWSSNTELTIQMRIVPKKLDSNRAVFHFDDSSDAVSITVWLGDVPYNNVWPGIEGAGCAGVIFEKRVIPLSGQMHLEELEWGIKHLRLKGTMNLDHAVLHNPPYKCIFQEKLLINEDQAITLGIKNLRFEIDTEVIYSWHSKGGHGLRL